MTSSRQPSRAQQFYALLALLSASVAGPGCWFDPCVTGDQSPPISFITTDRYQLAGAGQPGDAATLRAIPLQENPGLTYQWSAYDPAGASADHLFDTTEGPAARFVAGNVDGPYEGYCLISDACERQ